MREILFWRWKKAERLDQPFPKLLTGRQLLAARNLRLEVAALGSRTRMDSTPSSSLNHLLPSRITVPAETQFIESMGLPNQRVSSYRDVLLSR
jgi:hypothetical protein